MSRDRLWLAAVVAGVLTLAADPSHATLSLGAARPIYSNAADVGEDLGPCSATDGNGIVVVAWSRVQDLEGTSSDTTEIVFIRSTNDGGTWGSVEPVDPLRPADAGTFLYPCSLVTDGTAWLFQGYATDGVYRSTDDGQTWTPLAGIGKGIYVVDNQRVWVHVFAASTDGDVDEYVRRSFDSGATWSAPVVLKPDAGTDSDDDEPPFALQAFGPDGVFAVYYGEPSYVSVDSGASWSVSTMPALANPFYAATVAATPSGTLVVARPAEPTPPHEQYEIWITRSTDAGATWSTPTFATHNMHSPTLVAMDHSRLLLIGREINGWQDDVDLVVSRSVDGGLTWSPNAQATGSAIWDGLGGFYDGHDELSALLRTSAGRWLMVFESNADLTKDLGPSNGLDRDYDILVSSALDACPSEPSACASNDPRDAKVSLRHRSDGRDDFTWTWSGPSAGVTGHPMVNSSFAFCAYDSVASDSRLLFEKNMLVNATCRGGTACWRAVADGYRYADAITRNGAIKLFDIGSTDGTTRMKLKIAGPSFGPPPMPLSLVPDVRFQLHNLWNGNCLETTFSAAQANDAETFRAR